MTGTAAVEGGSPLTTSRVVSTEEKGGMGGVVQLGMKENRGVPNAKCRGSYMIQEL